MSNSRADIAMIKIAIKQLGISDDDGNAETGALSTYRQMLVSITGKDSVKATVMSDRERAKVLRHLRQKGFVPARSAKRKQRIKRAPGMASQKQLGLIYVLWQALEDSGEIKTPGKESLCFWVANFTKQFNDGAGYSAPEFLPGEAASQVIEQLKKWCRRQKVKWY